MPKKPAEPAPVEFWKSPLEPVYHNIRKNLKGHPHANFIEIYLGLGAIIFFLFFVSLAPYIGEKLGLISQRKEGQQSFAQEAVLKPEPEIEYISNEILVKIKKDKKVKDDSKPHDTGLGSLDKINKEHGVKGFEKVAKPSEKSKDPNHDIFQWYKVTLPGDREIIKEKPTKDEQITSLDKQTNKSPQKVQDTKLALAIYKQDPNVEAVGLNYVVRTSQSSTPEATPSATPEATPSASPDAFPTPSPTPSPMPVPNDPYFWSKGSWGQDYDDLWGLKKIQAEGAWNITTGSDQIVVAVIDTGIDYNHSDIQQNIWINSGEIPGNGIDDDGNGFIDDYYGWDFTNNDSDPMDDHGHGTHVAGTIGAVGNNGIGVVGVNWTTKVMGVKFLGADGSGTSANGAAALIYASDNGARVLNNSWGGVGTSTIIHDAINYVHDQKGAVVIAAAGNSNADASNFSPANEPNVITVSAFDHNDQKASFSNWGAKIDVAAPGGDSTDSSDSNKTYENILSLKAQVSPMCTTQRTVGEKYCRVRGTSMASPHVSGLAALILSYRPSFTPEEIRQVLRISADDVNDPGFDLQSGAGRINAAKSLVVSSVLKALITEPHAGTDISGSDTLEIRGIAFGPGFVSYELNYGAGSFPREWNLISRSEIPIEEGILGVWNLLNIQSGSYVIRLTAQDQQGRKFESYVSLGLEKDIRQLSNHPANQESPHIYGNKIVWTDTRNKGEFQYLLCSGFIANEPQSKNCDIYLYDLTTGTERQVTANPYMQKFPKIYDDLIVWNDWRTGKDDIYLFDLKTNTEHSITNLEPGNQTAFDIEKNIIVWENDRNGNWDVYLCEYDSTTGTCPQKRITSHSANQKAPRISGDKIVWYDDRNGNWDIFLYDLATNTEQQLSSGSADKKFPRIDGRFVTWGILMNTSRGIEPTDISYYDLATNREYQITTSPFMDHLPQIFGNTIVWQRLSDNDNWDVFLYLIPMSSPCDSFGDIDNDSYVTQKDSDLILQYDVGLTTLTTEQLRRADVNNDRAVDIKDALLILQYAEGSQDTFPVCEDLDQDGFSNTTEQYLGTDPLKACPTTATANDESPDPWPPDFNDNGIVQIDDVNFVSSRFNAKEGDANYTKRAELATQNGVIGIDDVNAATSRFNQSCSF